MATTIEMPKLGNTVEECLLTTWRKHPGDTVAAGDVIAEVETDKATFEVTATADGILLDTFYPEGALVPVFASICAIGAAGETAPDAAPVSGQPTPESSVRPDVVDAHRATSARAAGTAAGDGRVAQPQGSPVRRRARLCLAVAANRERAWRPGARAGCARSVPQRPAAF